MIYIITSDYLEGKPYEFSMEIIPNLAIYSDKSEAMKICDKMNENSKHHKYFVK